MNTFKYEEIKEVAIEKLEEMKGYYKGCGADLHNEIFNTDYCIIGTYQAKEWLGSEIFEAIETIKDYEESNFGSVTTDFSNSEKIVNMYVYIVGEEILNESTHLTDVCWNNLLEENDFDKILEEL